MPVIACPHCGTKLNGPDSVLGNEVVCGQCRQRFVAAAEQPFGSQHAQPAQAQEPQDAGLDSMESLTPGPAQTPQPEPPHQEPEPAQWQQPQTPEPPAPEPPRPPRTPWAPLPSAGGPSQPPGAPPVPPSPVPPPPVGGYGPPPVPGAGGQGPYMQAGPLPPASGAGAAMVLGIISLVFCCCWPVGLICSILAIVFSNKAIREIDGGLADPADRGKANAGRICGIIGLVLGILVAIGSLINLATGGAHYNVNF